MVCRCKLLIWSIRAITCRWRRGRWLSYKTEIWRAIRGLLHCSQKPIGCYGISDNVCFAELGYEDHWSYWPYIQNSNLIICWRFPNYYALIFQQIAALFTKESSDKEVFFTYGDSSHVEFIDDRKICQIADICERLARFCIDLGPKMSKEHHMSLIDRRINRINTLIENVKIIQKVIDNIEIK